MKIVGPEDRYGSWKDHQDGEIPERVIQHLLILEVYLLANGK